MPTERYAPGRHHRHSIRLKGYDYTQPGAYFITLCAHQRAHLFGHVADGEMHLNAWGEIAQGCWYDIPIHFPHTELDAFVVMPNHVHGIIWIIGARHAVPLQPHVNTPMTEQFGKPVPGSIPTIIRTFKSAVTKRVHETCAISSTPLWQRNYYEHIIRNDRALEAIRQYIVENPLRWHLDRYNPARAADDPLAQAIWDMLR